MTAQSLIIRNPEQRARAIEALCNMPLPLSVSIEPHIEGDQAHERAWYWWTLTIIADQAIVHGRKYSKEVWHEFYKQKFLPIIDVVDIRDRTVFMYQSTEKLSIRKRREYRYQVESDAAQELGVMFSDYKMIEAG
jgi:hypothetical protein